MTPLEEAVEKQIKIHPEKAALYGRRTHKLVDWFTGRVMAATEGAFKLAEVRAAVDSYLSRNT